MDPDFSEFTTEIDNATAEAIGEPGQRRFRLVALANGETSILWMEKQQLDALGQAIDQILTQIDESQFQSSLIPAQGQFDLDTTNQFRVGRLEVGYETEHDRILIVAYGIESDIGDPPGLSGLLSIDLAKAISEEASTVVSAGRPRCVLCGLPMGPGSHACAAQNGHLVNYA